MQKTMVRVSVWEENGRWGKNKYLDLGDKNEKGGKKN